MNINNKLRAGYPGIYLVTHEEPRADALLAATCKELKWNLHAWTITEGRFDTITGKNYEGAGNPYDVLDCIASLPEKTLLILKDYHLFLENRDAVAFRKLKDALFLAKTSNKCIVILAPVLKLPVELEKLFAVVELALPDKQQLKVVLDAICKSANKSKLAGNDLEAALAAASGLTTNEAEDAFALSIIESGVIQPEIVAREKAQTIKKNGILELIETPLTLDDVGGLDVMKEWLKRRAHTFSKAGRDYGLKTCRGMLATGVPGGGKSLTAKASAAAFGGIPLLKLDAGRIFGELVGASERNLRAVFQTCEAIAPCVLWIDELEKGFSKKGGDTDGGTSQRVFGALLNWMEEKTAPIFIVGTANYADRLDPALVSRFDETFFVDLPTKGEREEIWNIQIAKRERNPKDFDLSAIANATDGYTGREIEKLFGEALYFAFDKGREPTTVDIATIAGIMVPVSKMMADDICAMRKWSEGRCKRASSEAMAPAKKTRKLAA